MIPANELDGLVRLCLALGLQPYDVSVSLAGQVKNFLSLIIIVNRERTQQVLDVLGLRYGLDGSPPLTLAATARSLGRSPAWARKMEAQGLQHLRVRFTTPVRTFDPAIERALELDGWERK